MRLLVSISDDHDFFTVVEVGLELFADGFKVGINIGLGFDDLGGAGVELDLFHLIRLGLGVGRAA